MPILGSFAGISSKAYGLTSNLVGDYFFIAKSDAPTAAVSSLDFSSIPQNYTHLEIRFVGSGNTANTGIRARFNGDSGATQYSFYYSYGDGTTGTNTNTTGQSFAYFGSISNPGTNSASMAVAQIQNYANTNIFKSHSAFNYQYGGTQYITLTAGTWKSGSAITSISILPQSGTFNQYCAAYLYGIK
jgi:hypothetical protein